MTLVGRYGNRILPLEEFFVGPSRSAIEPDEILTEITFLTRPTTGSAYFKFGLRRSGALAVVGRRCQRCGSGDPRGAGADRPWCRGSCADEGKKG